MAKFYQMAAGGSRKRLLACRRPNVSPICLATRIQTDMGDSKSGVIPGSRLQTADRVAKLQSGSPPRRRGTIAVSPSPLHSPPPVIHLWLCFGSQTKNVVPIPGLVSNEIFPS
jgi:hypothetical protein